MLKPCPLAPLALTSLREVRLSALKNRNPISPPLASHWSPSFQTPFPSKSHPSPPHQSQNGSPSLTLGEVQPQPGLNCLLPPRVPTAERGQCRSPRPPTLRRPDDSLMLPTEPSCHTAQQLLPLLPQQPWLDLTLPPTMHKAYAKSETSWGGAEFHLHPISQEKKSIRSHGL